MKFYIPTEIIHDKDCVSKHGDIFKRYGEKCLLITGRHSAKANGSLQDVVSCLEKNRIQYIVFSEIEENPSVETVMKAAQMGIREKVDFVVGIGGGSPMDAAKAIALMINHPDKNESLLYQEEELAALPIVEIPTTAGTGSEATPYAILTLHSEETKRSIAHRIFPEVALVDAKYLKFAPYSLLVHTAVDTLAHTIESALNTNTNRYNQMLSYQGMQWWKNAKENLLSNHFTEEAYEDLMMASTVGGMAIAHTGTSIPHGLSYALTYHLGTPHGKAVGIFLPGFLRCYHQHDAAAVNKILDILEFTDIDDFSRFIHRLLGEVVVDKDLMKRTIQGILENKAKLKNYPFPISEKEISAIY